MKNERAGGRMRKKTGMKEIAEKAQVSVTTVANVMHGRKEKVSKETYEKIDKIIKENGYQLDLRARLLAGKKQLLFVILDFRKANSQSDYQKMRALVEHFYKRGIITLLYFPADLQEGVHLATIWNAKGVIILGEFSFKEQFCAKYKNCTVISLANGDYNNRQYL